MGEVSGHQHMCEGVCIKSYDFWAVGIKERKIA